MQVNFSIKSYSKSVLHSKYSVIDLNYLIKCLKQEFRIIPGTKNIKNISTEKEIKNRVSGAYFFFLSCVLPFEKCVVIGQLEPM